MNKLKRIRALRAQLQMIRLKARRRELYKLETNALVCSMMVHNMRRRSETMKFRELVSQLACER